MKIVMTVRRYVSMLLPTLFECIINNNSLIIIIIVKVDYFVLVSQLLQNIVPRMMI